MSKPPRKGPRPVWTPVRKPKGPVRPIPGPTPKITPKGS